MSDPNKPYTTEPLNSPYRHPNATRGGTGTSWMVGGILGAVLIGALLFWGLGADGDRVADTTPPASSAQTTGAATPATPANPSQNPSTNPSQNRTTPPARAQ